MKGSLISKGEYIDEGYVVIKGKKNIPKMTLANPVSKVDIPPSNGKSIRTTRVELIHNTFNITQ